MKRLPELLYVGVALFGAVASGYAGTTLTFDGVNPYEYVIMPSSYGGLSWDNFFIENALLSSGWTNGMMSSPNVAFNGLGQPASFTSNSPLTFESAYFTSVYANQDQLMVEGFSGATEVYDQTYVIYHSAVTLIDFNYAGVDRVLFSTASQALFTMDNMVISVPEPSTCALASLAALLLGLRVRRRMDGPAAGLGC